MPIIVDWIRVSMRWRAGFSDEYGTGLVGWRVLYLRPCVRAVGLSWEGSVGIAEKGAVDRRDADVRPDAEDRSEHFLPNDRSGRAFLDDAAIVQDHEALRVPGRLVQVMERHDHGEAVLTVQLLDEVEGLDLVVDVQERRGLVQEEDARLLREGKRNPDPLALTPGEAIQEAVPETAG